jgi:peptidoglycan/LPS O-acetylase OafA/YrhL
VSERDRAAVERETPPPGRRRGLRRDIQGLRAVAVGLVVADHAGIDWLSGGFVGVDVFFVVSGFLITQLLVRELVSTGRVSVPAFYGRRARRILPAACVVLAATVVYASFELLVTRSAGIRGDVLWSALFLANVHFASLQTDYFAAGTPASPVQHFWSLAVEEQFYLVWPAVLALVAWGVARRIHRAAPSPDGVSSRVLRQVTWLVAATWVISLAWSIQLTSTDPTAAYFSAPARAWELATGALLALGATRMVRLPSSLSTGLSLVGLGAIALAAVAFGPGTPFPGMAALLPVLGTAAVLAAGIERDDVGPSRLLVIQPMLWVGAISYSLYLWHWPVLMFGRPYVRDWPGVTGSVALVAVAVVLAVVSYRVVETPFRRRRFWMPTRRGLLLWPIALVVTLGALQVASIHEQRVLDDRARAAASFDPSSVPERLRTERTGDQIHDELAESLDRAAVSAPIPFPLETDLTELDGDHAWPGCGAKRDESSDELCTLGDASSATKVVVFGDSHAHMWLPAMDQVGKRDGFAVVPVIKWGCSPTALGQLEERGGSENTGCVEFRSWALDQIRRLEPELVVVSSRAYPPDLLLSGRFDPDEWRQAAFEGMSDVDALGFSSVLMGDVSHLEERPTRCLAKLSSTMATCTDPVDPRVIATNRGLAAGAREAGVRFVDVNRLACLEAQCPMVAGQISTFRDKQHLSATWVRHVADPLGELLRLPSR